MLKFLLAGDEQFEAKNEILEFRVIVSRNGLAFADSVDPLDRVFRGFVRLLRPQKSESRDIRNRASHFRWLARFLGKKINSVDRTIIE